MDPLEAVDLAIREARPQDARALLDRLTRSGENRHYPPERLANLFWRTGQSKRGLRVLSPVFPDLTENAARANPEAAVEYAACLVRQGAFAEARWLLSIDAVRAMRQAPLYTGFCHVETWDYAAASPFFRRYVEQPGLDAYARLVGMANLASALVYEGRHDQFRAMARGLLHEASVSKNNYLLGFTLEVSAAHHVLAGEYALARKIMDEAEQRWASVQDLFRFFLKKWRALGAYLEKPSAATGEALETLKQEATTLGHWETVRDVDRRRAIRTNDETLFRHVIFHTPYPAFRETLTRHFSGAALPKEMAWTMTPAKAKKAGKTTTVRWLVDAKERDASALSRQAFSLFAILASDGYRPHRLATLFSRIFPNEHYSTSSSPKRLHEALRRLEQGLKSDRVPMDVEEIDSEYRLRATAPVTLVLPLPGDGVVSWQPLETRLVEIFGEKPFSMSEAVTALDLPRRTLVRQLQALVATGFLAQNGAGPATRYRLNRSRAA